MALGERVPHDYGSNQRWLSEAAAPQRGLGESDESAEENETDELAPEAVGLNFEYFDGSEWQDVWDSTASGALPVSVRVTITLRPPGSGTADGNPSAEGEPSEEELIRASRTVRIFTNGPGAG